MNGNRAARLATVTAALLVGVALACAGADHPAAARVIAAIAATLALSALAWALRKEIRP